MKLEQNPNKIVTTKDILKAIESIPERNYNKYDARDNYTREAKRD